MKQTNVGSFYCVARVMMAAVSGVTFSTLFFVSLFLSFSSFFLVKIYEDRKGVHGGQSKYCLSQYSLRRKCLNGMVKNNIYIKNHGTAQRSSSTQCFQQTVNS